MNDLIKNNNSVIKGKTKIELFNKDGNLEYTHEESNIFSEAWLKYANRWMWGANNTSVSRPSGYMCLYNTDKTAQELISRQINGEIVKVGYADLYKADTNSSGKKGTINSSLTQYFYPNIFSMTNRITYVCDFPAGVATGSFNTISLCTNTNDKYNIYTKDYHVKMFDDTRLNVFVDNFISLRRGELLYCSPNDSST